jgi:hypothetical protein
VQGAEAAGQIDQRVDGSIIRHISLMVRLAHLLLLGAILAGCASSGVVQNLPIPGNARAPKPPSCEGRISSVGWKVVLVREAASLAGSGPLGLKRSESQQGEPMRMVLTRH